VFLHEAFYLKSHREVVCSATPVERVIGTAFGTLTRVTITLGFWCNYFVIKHWFQLVLTRSKELRHKALALLFTFTALGVSPSGESNLLLKTKIDRWGVSKDCRLRRFLI